MKHHLHIVTYSAAWSYTHLVPGLDLGKPLTKTFLVGQVRRPWLIFIVRIDGKEPEVRGSTIQLEVLSAIVVIISDVVLVKKNRSRVPPASMSLIRFLISIPLIRLTLKGRA
jgi:hypothetical protein